jgi:hypothetical protein
MKSERRAWSAVHFATIVGLAAFLAGNTTGVEPPSIGQLERCGGCRDALVECYEKAKDEDPASRKRSHEKCNADAMRCFQKCGARGQGEGP